MFIDDWPTQITRSLWCMMQDEYPQTLRKVLGDDNPTLALASKRLRTWLEEKRISFPKYPDTNFSLEREIISCALDEVDWNIITFRIALALNIPVNKVSDYIICPRCRGTICQLCLLCINPACQNAHQVDCLSEKNDGFQLGPLFFDFPERKLVLRVGEAKIPISYKEYKRFFIWLDIRKNG